jgi:hypothetical protein
MPIIAIERGNAVFFYNKSVGVAILERRAART